MKLVEFRGVWFMPSMVVTVEYAPGWSSQDWGSTNATALLRIVGGEVVQIELGTLDEGMIPSEWVSHSPPTDEDRRRQDDLAKRRVAARNEIAERRFAYLRALIDEYSEPITVVRA